MLTFEEIKEKVFSIARSHGVDEVYLFGSYARNEATEKSDIDMLIKPGKIKTLVHLISFLEDMEFSTLGKGKVDILTVDQLEDSSILKGEIDKDKILLYRK
ncbi:MAG: hypothetical protein H6Q70_70 [Firmicutes bacterium]|nr:hypothetical protein [Bacillota bacterium]